MDLVYIYIYICIVCRPRKQVEPSLQYIFETKIDKEKAARIQKKAREIVNKAKKDIEMDELEYQLRVKREMQEEMRLLNVFIIYILYIYVVG